MKNKFNNGITLIALAVTIIVMLIIAGTSINLIFGENSLIKQAKKSKEDKSGKENYGYFRHSDYGRRTCAVPVRYERNGAGP